MEDHNQILGKSIEMAEVEIVVNQMPKDKVLGPDGFTTNFFHVGPLTREHLVIQIE